MSDPQIIAGHGAGIRISRLHLQGATKPYVVDLQKEGQVHPCALITGPVSTGKSSVLEFISYGLGGSSHPQHPEVLAQVTACFLEILSGGDNYVIHRSVGRTSTVATEYKGSLEDVLAGRIYGRLRPISPAGDPDSLSSFLLSLNGLEGVELKKAPTKEESDTDPLSIRDLLWLSHLPNERLDDKNLLFENAYMKSHKLRQVIDVVFGIHDDRRAELGDRIKRLERQLASSRSDLQSASRFVNEQEPKTRGELEIELDMMSEYLQSVESQLTQLDDSIARDTDYAEELRDKHRRAAQSATEAVARLRDRETLLQRLTPLRAQYNDDIRKLTMLVEAHGLFDPLNVLVCPACFSEVIDAPVLIEGNCTLCGTQLPAGGTLSLGSASRRSLEEHFGDDMHDEAREEGEASDAGIIVRSHLRSTKARLSELVAYIEAVDNERQEAARAIENTRDAETDAARALNRATADAIAPFLTQRDEIALERTRASERVEEVRRGMQLHDGLKTRQEQVGRTETNLQALREALKALDSAGTERPQVRRLVSERFGAILRDFEYPKLERPFVNDRWEPLVRDLSYQEASSGARTLLSLAWMLAIFEVAFENGNPHPGFLMIDSPQKNIGGSGEIDEEFADAAIVEAVYSHLDTWLNGPGQGAQIIIVDNDPPAITQEHVRVHYSRDPARPPYGLIDNEVGLRSSAEASGHRH